MPRSVFNCNPNLPYHVYDRTNNREKFSVPLDWLWKALCQDLHFVSHIYKIKVHAFVLMPNHYHMYVTAPEGNLSEAMWRLKSQISYDIRLHSGRINRIWGTRFKRTLVDNERYFNYLYKYILRNPVRAKLCEKVEDYPFSSIQFSNGNRIQGFPLFDDFVNPLNSPDQLKDLNRDPGKEKDQAIRKALKRSLFLPMPENGMPNILEREDY